MYAILNKYRNNSKSILSKQRLHNKFNENNENNPTNKYLINDKPEAIETKNLRLIINPALNQIIILSQKEMALLIDYLLH